MNLFAIAVLVYAVVFLYGMIKSSFTEAAIPNEYQEVTNIELTKSFFEGKNPYALDVALGGEEPGMIYAYGPVLSLIAAFFARFSSVDLISLHYVISLFAMFFAGMLAAGIVMSHTKSMLPWAAAFLLTIFCTWRYGYINAVPDALAFFLMVLAMWLESKKDFKAKEPLQALVIILAFYTKMYLAFIALPLFVYKLIKKKKRAFIFMAWGLVLFGISAVIVTISCPLYWTYSFYFLHGPWKPDPATLAANENGIRAAIDVLLFRNTAEPTMSGWAYEALQLRSLAGIFGVLFVIALIAVIDCIRKKFKKLDDMLLLSLITLLVSIPALLYLGQNDGAWLSYFLQMQILPLILFCVIFLDNKCADEKSKPVMRWLWFAVFSLTMLFTILRSSVRLPYYRMSEEQMQTWEDTYRMLDEYSAKGEIYYSPVLAFHAIKNDKYFYNNGLAGQYLLQMYEEYKVTPWMQTLFPHAGEVFQKHADYMNEISRKIKNGDYVLITAIEGNEGNDRVLDLDEIDSAPYRKLEEIDLPVSRISYTVKFWELK